MSVLHSNYLKQLDLQDIVVFLNLLELRSARRTAELMNVSQPTVSYCLKRLRGCFDDALFVSAQGVLQPTAKAEMIAPYLRTVVESVNRCAAAESQASRQPQRPIWRLCAPEYFELSLLPDVLAQVSGQPSPPSVHVQRLGRDLPVDTLLAGEADIAIGFGPGYHQQHPELQWQSLIEDEFVCLTSDPTLTAGGPMHLEAFCTAPHVFPTPWLSEKNMVDSWLEKLGRSRTVLASANSYQACVHIVAAVPAILALPARLLPQLRVPPHVQVGPPPLGFPRFTLDMIWTRDRGRSHTVATARSAIESVARRLADAQQAPVI